MRLKKFLRFQILKSEEKKNIKIAMNKIQALIFQYNWLKKILYNVYCNNLLFFLYCLRKFKWSVKLRYGRANNRKQVFISDTVKLKLE